MKYTKGKWIYSEAIGKNRELCFYEIRSNGHIFASCYKNEGTINFPKITIEQAKANAKLISKAPEMYEALKLYVSDLRNVVPDSPARNSRIDQIELLLKEIS